jgi:hypothetical protein
MFAVKLTKAAGGRQVSTKRKGGRAIGRLRRDSVEGKGLTQEFYEKPLSHAFQGLGISNTKKMENLKVKTSRPKKYISLNF